VGATAFVADGGGESKLSHTTAGATAFVADGKSDVPRM
jgi:hypothetical protein